MEVKLYVGNLPFSTTEKDLRLLFAQAGTVTSVELIKERQMGQSKGFAYVIMGSLADAQKAISLFNAHSIADHKLLVKLARMREAQDGYSSRLSAFAAPDRKGNARKPKATPSGYQSRLSAFGTGNRPSGPRRRGGGKRD